MSYLNIHDSPYQEGTSARGERWRYLDLSGAHLGVRVEETPPGGSSSIHHYHSQEEEHVVVLEGSPTLILGEKEHALRAGDHICFRAGVEVAHHLENRTNAPVKFLVFGERKEDDVVFYPEHERVLVKALGWKQMSYPEFEAQQQGKKER